MRGLWLFLLYGTLSASVCAPLFDEPNGLGVSDWDVHLFYYAAVVESVVEYGQPPFWNPWYAVAMSFGKTRRSRCSAPSIRWPPSCRCPWR